MLLVWVADIIAVSNSLELMNNFKYKLYEKFNMKDLGNGKLSVFLGIDFEQADSWVIMSLSR